jgi:predicted ATPase
MITSVTLANFKSFDEEQTIPLQPMTVLVGPNNAGKSNLVSVGRFIRNARAANVGAAIAAEGGEDFVFHRPRRTDTRLRLAWRTTDGDYSLVVGRPSSSDAAVEEALTDARGSLKWSHAHGSLTENALLTAHRTFANAPEDPSETATIGRLHGVWAPMVGSRDVKLSLPSLRADAELVPAPRMAGDGSNLAAVLGLWRGSDPDRAERLHDFLRLCLPEIKHALVKPAPTPGYQRLWVQQMDGEQFDAEHLSEGVLCFIALAMHAIDAEPGSLLFVEEPEQSIHPRRLGDLVELFRRLIHERKCQVVLATHSPVLLDEFRDEPEAILLMRRGDEGTRVKSLAELPVLLDALRAAEPGEMLANGFFNEPF